MLFPPFAAPTDRRALRVGDDELTYRDLVRQCRRIEATIDPTGTVAVVMSRDLASIVGLLAVLTAGATAVPVNPHATDPEIAHVVADATPTLVLHGGAALTSPAWAGLTSQHIELDPDTTEPAQRTYLADEDPTEPAPTATATARRDEGPDAGDRPALVMYTSGTTGPPKGVELSSAALAANLDALAQAWAWTHDDHLVQALPLHHVHGLVLGVLGPLRRGASLHHTAAFDPATTSAALAGGATMHFGVPTIYARLAHAASADPVLATNLRRTRLLVSGSAGLPMPVHDRIRELTGHTIIERYGMTETLITTAVPAGTTGRAGSVGPALPGVQLRIVDDDGVDIVDGEDSMGEILVRTPGLFSGYHGRPADTAATLRDGWFVTGDMATRDGDGFVRIVGRRSTDLIKSGGYRIGAGEIEDALLSHPLVLEAAVKGVPDEDLGERVVAWVVPAEVEPDVAAIVAAHLADRLSAPKRPRTIVIVDALPRNAMGKVIKADLVAPLSPDRP